MSKAKKTMLFPTNPMPVKTTKKTLLLQISQMVLKKELLTMLFQINHIGLTFFVEFVIVLVSLLRLPKK